MKEHNSYFKLIACYLVFAMFILGISSNVDAATADTVISTQSGQTTTLPAVSPSQGSMNSTAASHEVRGDLGKDLMNEISDVNGTQKPHMLLAQMPPYVEQPAFENQQQVNEMTREQIREQQINETSSNSTSGNGGGNTSFLNVVLGLIFAAAAGYGAYYVMSHHN